MRDGAEWQETKFVRGSKGWRSARDRTAVSPASFFVTDLTGRAYASLVETHARPGLFADLGCGRVPLFGMYRHLADDVLCVDWPSGPHESRHVDEFADLNKGLPQITDASIDTVILTDVLEHLSSPDVLLADTARILKPGGRVLGGVPFLYPLHEEPHDYYRYTEHRLRQMLQESGLVVLHLEYYGGPVEVILDIIGKQVCFASWVGRLHARIAHAMRRIIRVPQSQARRFPLGYTFAAEKPATR